ncbi:MAG: gliding motility-associated C-terminal domain-containing protein [Bacteroidota bacterium]
MGISRIHYPLLYLLLFFFGATSAYGQVAISSTQPGLGDMEVCVDSATFSFSIGPFTANLTGVEVRLTFPDGIYYVQNSLNNLPATTVNLVENSYLGQVLSLDGSAINSRESYEFEIQLFAGCDALPDFLSGQSFSNTVEVFENGTLYESYASPIYNPAIDYGQLSMSAGATPSGVAGEVVTREISIFSTGSGCIKLLNWYDAHGADVSIDSVYFQGQKLNTWTNGDTIFYDFTGIDFSLIGDGDDEFCSSDGAIILTEYIQILGCTDKNSNVSAGWGCNGVYCSDFSLSADVVVSNLQPSLEFEPRPDTLSGCFYNQPNRKELVIRNTGVGSLSNLEVELKKNYYAGQFPETKYDGLDSSSVEIRYNDGNFQPISPRNVEMNIYGNACSLPLAYRFYIDVAFLLPGDSITLAFDMINCVPDICGESEIRQGSWGYNARYDLPCVGSSTVIANQTGGFPGILRHQVSNFDPPTLVDGKEVSFTTTMEQSEVIFPEGGAYLVRYTLPTCGASFSGNSSDFAWTNIGGDLSWPLENFSSSPTQVEAIFQLDSIPTNFSINGSEIKLDLSGNCSCPSTDSIQFLQKEIFYLPTPGCSPLVEIPIFCDTISVIVDPCIVTTCNGMQILEFDFQRSNFDLPDSDLNRIPDGGTVLSPDVRSNRARLGDTIQAQMKGFVNGAGTFTYGYTDMTVAFSQYLTPISGTVNMYDQSTGNTLTCTNVLPTLVGGTDIFRIDYSPGTIAGTCAAFGGLSLETGDSISLDLSFVVSSTDPQNIEVGAIFPVEMYLSNVLNPTDADKFTCQGTKFSELMQLVPMVDTSFVTQISAQSCQQTQARTYINMFTGGSYTDMFPFEYRVWSFPDSLIVTPPANYNYVGANILLRFTPYIQVMNVDPVDPTANPLVFDLKALVNNGSLIYPDDGYELQFFTTWLPECDAVSNQQVNVPVEGRFHWANGLEAYDTPKNYLPTIRHNTPDISLNNQSAATQDGLRREVSWDMQVSNNSISSNSPYTWMAFYSPSGEIQVVDLEDNNGNPVSQNNGIYELGLINTSASKDYRINATYDLCSLDTLIVYTGWECAGYPASLATACQTDSFYLAIDPKPADGQISLNTTVSDTVSLFEPITYNLAILSTQIANLDELLLEIFHANSGLDFITGSAELEYPIGSGFRPIADPVAIAGGYRFTMANYDSTLAAEGLAGLSSSTAPYRQFNIRFDLAPNCNFASGDTWLMNLQAALPCGDPLLIQRIMEPIYIDGGLAPYQANLSSNLNQVYSCDLYEMRFSFSATDTIGGTDSLEIFIPDTLSYVAGLFNTIHNPLPDTMPSIESATGGSWYKWPLDSTLISGDSIVFIFGLQKSSVSTCPSGTDISLILRSTYQYPGNCQTGGGNFNGSTGLDSISIPISNSFVPQLSLSYGGLNPRSVSQDSQRWNLNLIHQSGNYPIAYPWMRFVSVSGNSQEISLEYVTGGNLIPSSNGFWRLDSLQIGENVSLNLDALVSFCGPDTLLLLYGYNCDAYPMDPTAISCEHDTLLLIVDPAFPYIQVDTISVIDPLCFGANNGEIQLLASGGPSPYNYSLNGGTFTSQSTFNGLSAGIYLFYARDSIGCVDSISVSLIQPTQLMISVDSLLDIDCSGDSSGEIHVSASGGSAPYQFALDGGSYGNTASFFQVGAGLHMLKVRDSQGCEDSTQISLNENSPLLSLMQIDQEISCFGESDGALSVAISGGIGSITYNWQGIGNAGNSISGLVAGDYVVEIQDSLGCVTVDSISLNDAPEIFSSLNLINPISCQGLADAEVEALISGGIPGYIFTWSAGASSSNIASNIPAGMLYLEVSDNNGCIKEDSLLINEPPSLDVSASGQDVSCFGLNDGQVSALVSGGTPPYSYVWNKNPGLNTPTLLNRLAGNYEIEVTDANGCQDTASVQISQPQPIQARIQAFDETCSNANGVIWVELSGGSTPYTFIWNNDPSLNTDTLYNQSAGNFSLRIVDGNTCEENLSFSLNNQASPQLDVISLIEPTCHGASDGQAEVRVNGSGRYNFLWQHSGETTPAVANLSAGSYKVSVDDGTCQGSLDVLVEEPEALFTQIDSLIRPGCPGEDDGSIFIGVSGGSAPYFYEWAIDPSFTTSGLTGLATGFYEVYVRDQNNCRDTLNAFLPDPVPLAMQLDIQEVLCFGESNGGAVANASGGTAPYQYNWSTGTNGDSLQGQPAGTYQVVISDANGCNIDSSFTISEPTQLLLDMSKEDVACYGGESGRASVLVSGGRSPYQYLWSNGESLAAISQLSMGSYRVSVEDANGCVAEDSISLIEGDSIQIELISQIAASCGMPNGSARVLANGGSGTLSYVWDSNPIQSGPAAINLYGVSTGRTYWVEAIDELGCTDSLEVQIESRDRPEAYFLTVPDLSQPIFRSEAQIQFINQSENSNAYFWDFGEDGAFSNEIHPEHSYEKAGEYLVSLVAMDAATQCPDTMNITVIVIEDGMIFTASAFSPNDDGNNDMFYAYGEGIQEFEMLIFDRFGKLVIRLENIADGWDGRGPDGRPAAEGVYTFALKAKLNDGTKLEHGGSITLFR